MSDSGYVIVVTFDGQNTPVVSPFRVDDAPGLLAVISQWNGAPIPVPLPDRWIRVTWPDRLNVRISPSVTAAVIGIAPHGAKYRAIAEKNDSEGNPWVCIDEPDHWICRIYRGSEKAVFV